MGDYLLKGYKMLGSTCPYCETILLRTKQGVDYCVACSELDSDATKDDPALNEIAAQRQAQESQLKEVPSVSEASGGAKRLAATSSASSSALNAARSTSNSRKSSNLPPGDVGAKGSVSVDDVDRPLPQADFATPSIEAQLRGAVDAVLRKLEWATGLLVQTQDIDTCVRLCGLIKSCAETVRALRSVDCRDAYNNVSNS